MKRMTSKQVQEAVRRRLKKTLPTIGTANFLLGISGTVASGKSHFCQVILPDVKTLLQRPVIYLPFDMWINVETVRVSPTYAGRFLLDDLVEALRCAKKGERFLVPRYDMVKKIGVQSPKTQLSTQQVVWNGKSFVRYTGDLDLKNLQGSAGFYIETESGYLYSLYPATRSSVFVFDGTLVFPEETQGMYDLKVFVETTWSLRIARMMRRFNRKEVFGETSKTMEEYVGFLVDEARMCADAEVYLQLRDDMLVVESVPDTLSNYLDLAYLQWYIEQPNILSWVTSEEVEADMRECLQRIREEHDTEVIASYRLELLVLLESKHLLSLRGREAILGELAAIIL